MAGDFIVQPNTIDLDTVFAKFAAIGDNLAVLITVICLIVVYWFGVLLLRRMDKKDLAKVYKLLSGHYQELQQLMWTVKVAAGDCHNLVYKSIL